VTAEPLAETRPDSATREPLLRTEALTIRFGGLTALNQVNFAVQRGEIRAVIGPNGAGKSTFFNCLTGVLRPSSGRIIFNGEDITGLPPNRISRKGIARSYQITSILPNATTLEKVCRLPTAAAVEKLTLASRIPPDLLLCWAHEKRHRHSGRLCG